MPNDQNNIPVLRTEDCAQRIEHVLKMTFTAEQFRQVCSYLRLYRQHAIGAVVDRFLSEGTKKREGKS
jgi:hypothetical protein